VAARVLAGLGVGAGDIERRLDRTAPLRKPREGGPPGDDAEALASIGIDLDEIRRKVEESFGPGALEQAPAAPRGAGRTTMTREAKQSVELAAREARALRHSYIGTEHLLLGLLSAAERNPRGDFSPETVSDLGIDPAQVRQRILDELRRGSA
jgi:ATP-dependent Clp protease ATP-binding subunit ClpA